MAAGRDLFAVKKDGREVPVEIALSPIQRSTGLVIVTSIRDVSERKASDAARAAALREKETLLKEIHHRVKNNLQIISSLFYLQARETTDAAVQAQLDDSRNRIHSIALLHDLLYRAEDVARVDLAQYLNQLAANLQAAVGVPASQVRVRVDGGGVVLGLEHAVPCALLVNELVSNAFKHAFPAGRCGSVTIDVSRADHEVHVAVADDGVGLPPGFDWRHSESLGLQLVQTLAQQLRGSVDLVELAGKTRFDLTFHVDGPL